MFVIRNDQMKMFEEYIRQVYVDRMTRHLRKNFPQQTASMDDAGLSKFVTNGIDKAATYRINDEEDVRKYLEYMCIYFPDFDTNPATAWAGDILRPNDVDGTRKIRRIEKHTLLSKEGFL